MFWQWVTVIGLSMTPALILGPTAACVAGIEFGWNRWLLIGVVAVASFVEGLLVIKVTELAHRSTRLRAFIARSSRLTRWGERWDKSKAVAWSRRWGPWAGLVLGTIAVGTEPILIAFKWMEIDTRRLLAPLAVACVLSAVVNYALVVYGAHQLTVLQELWALIQEVREL